MFCQNVLHPQRVFCPLPQRKPIDGASTASFYVCLLLIFGAFCLDVRTLTFCRLMGFPLNHIKPLKVKLLAGSRKQPSHVLSPPPHLLEEKMLDKGKAEMDAEKQSPSDCIQHGSEGSQCQHEGPRNHYRTVCVMTI